MKRVVLLITLAMMAMSANAQLNNLLNKAAQKAGEKATQAAANAVKNRLGLNGQNKQQSSYGQGDVGDYSNITSNSNDKEQLPTIYDLMAQMPALPTPAQLIDYKNAEANEMTLKIMTSPITMFRTQMMTLSAQSMVLGFADMDSVRATGLTTQLTGLTDEEIKAMENMSDEEQDAYIMAYWQSGRADEARQRAAENAEKYAQMTSSQVDQFTAVNDKVEAIYKEAQKLMKPIYERYAKQLENAEGKAYNKLMAEYYSKIAAIQHDAVTKAMQIRKAEQLPIAEKIEKINEGIRKSDPTAIIPNYIQMFAAAYFAEAEKLFEAPTYFEEEE